MEREESFRSSTDLSSVSYSSDYYNNSPHLPLCEWEEHQSPWRPLSGGSDTDSQISANSSRTRGSLHDTLGQVLKELLDTRSDLKQTIRRLLLPINHKQKMAMEFLVRQVDQKVILASKLRKKNANFSIMPWKRRSEEIVELKKSTISDLNTLNIVARNFILGRSQPSSVPVTRPLTELVGHSHTLDRLVTLVMSRAHGVVGVHGTRGIGKTRILQQFCEEIAKRHRKFTVIWITIPHDATILQILQDITEKLNIPKHTSPSVLYSLLCVTKLVLILDGLEDVLDIHEVGIPRQNPLHPYFFSCIVISSTSEVVCRKMGATECLEVPSLEWPESLQLFSNMVRQAGREPEPWEGWTTELLRICAGLPQSIIDLAEVVSKATSPDVCGPDPLSIFSEYFANRDPFDVIQVSLDDGTTRNGIIPWVGRTTSGASIIISPTTKLPPFPIRLMKRSSKLVGREHVLYRIRELVIDESICVVGVHGMRGIGKTRILEEFHDELTVLSGIVDFNVVIWITIPDDTSMLTIQQEIADQLNPPSKAHHDSLSNMRFLLIIDGLRGILKVDQLGIPLPVDQSKCKIVVSSRSMEVCRLMGANARGCIGVPLLESEESFQLFNDVVNEVGEAPWERGAVELVRSCGGLPLALVGVGETVKKDPTSNLFETGPLSLMTIL